MYTLYTRAGDKCMCLRGEIGHVLTPIGWQGEEYQDLEWEQKSIKHQQQLDAAPLNVRQQPDCSFLLWIDSAGNRWCWQNRLLASLRCVQHVARLAPSFRRPFSSRCGPRQLLLLLNGPGRLSALMQISLDESEGRKQLSDFWKSPCRVILHVKLLDRRNPPGICFWWGFSACLFLWNLRGSLQMFPIPLYFLNPIFLHFCSCTHFTARIKPSCGKPWGALSCASSYQPPPTKNWSRKQVKPQQACRTRRHGEGWCNKLLHCVGVCSAEPWLNMKESPQQYRVVVFLPRWVSGDPLHLSSNTIPNRWTWSGARSGTNRSQINFQAKQDRIMN